MTHDLLAWIFQAGITDWLSSLFEWVIRFIGDFLVFIFITIPLTILGFIFITIPLWILGLIRSAFFSLLEFILDTGETILIWLFGLLQEYWWALAIIAGISLVCLLIALAVEHHDRERREYNEYQQAEKYVHSLQSEYSSLRQKLRQLQGGRP